jgi:hypothetical protein
MSPMELRALPARVNNGAFKPFNEDAYYLFNFTNVHGDWLRWGPQWPFWVAHTGPNAWLVNALIRYAAQRPSKPFVDLAETIAQAMLRLQDKDAGGAIRYGPKDMWHAPEASAAYQELNTENNVSAYVALRMLAGYTGKVEYVQAADRILTWLQTSGVYDSQTHALRMGMEWKNRRWEVQPVFATDSGGTWTISALGAETIDRLWGPGAAYQMWRAIRTRTGRTADFKAAGEKWPLAGLDFTDSFAAEEGLISPEWSAGGIFALRELITYYRTQGGVDVASLERDLQTMTAFIRQNPNSYAIGPGHGGTRKGATGFRWSSPPPEVQAMASVYATLALENKVDPLGWWRKTSR